VASTAEHKSRSAFALLLHLVHRHFSEAGFEDALADILRENMALIGLWENWSADQGWTHSAYTEDTVTGWFDRVRQYVRVHPDRPAALAAFIHRMAAWLSRRALLRVSG
jgi:hypothetical protein